MTFLLTFPNRALCTSLKVRVWNSEILLAVSVIKIWAMLGLPCKILRFIVTQNFTSVPLYCKVMKSHSLRAGSHYAAQVQRPSPKLLSFLGER